MPNPRLCASQTITVGVGVQHPKWLKVRHCRRVLFLKECQPSAAKNVTAAQLIPIPGCPSPQTSSAPVGYSRPQAACQLQIPRGNSWLSFCHFLLGYALQTPASTPKAACEGFFFDWLIGWLICEMMTLKERKHCSLSNSPTNVLLLEERTEVITDLTF